jgi:hypothetical protein
LKHAGAFAAVEGFESRVLLSATTSGDSGATDPWMAAFFDNGQTSTTGSTANASEATEQQSANDDDAATETAEGDASLPEPTVSGGFTTTTTVNGDATTTTYTLTSSISLESGSMAGGDPNNNSRWDIPTDWIDTASTIPEESDGSESDDSENDAGNANVTSDDETDAAPTDESGVRFRATATITVSVTTGPYTAPDGSTGTTTSITFGVTGSVVIMVSGSWSTGDEGNTGTVLTGNDAGEAGPATLPSVAESSMTRAPRELILGGNGTSVSASGESFWYAYATLGFSVTISNTTMDNGAAGGGPSAPSASLNLSLGSGSFSTDQSDITVQESSESGSGSNAESVQVKEKNVSGSATSFALNLGGDDDAGDDATGEGDAGSSNAPSPSPISAAPAFTSVAGAADPADSSGGTTEEEDGPLSFSSSSFNRHQKTTLYATQSSQQSASSQSSSSTNADIEDSSSGSTSLSFSINGFDYETTSKNKSEFSYLSESQSSSDSPVGSDGRPSTHSEAASSHVIETLEESDRTFGFGFGSDGLSVTNEYSSNDTVSDVLKSESTSGSWRLVYPTITSSLEMMTNPQSTAPYWVAGPELEMTSGHNIQFNYGGNLEDGFEGSYSETTGFSQEFLNQEGTVYRYEYTLPVQETFPNTNDAPTQPTLESILNEYRDRATNIARWQAQLQTTTDPGMRDYLQGLINSEQSILSTIATNAINAGATQEQLNQISTEAQAAAAGNPIELQTLDTFNDLYDDSAAPGYFYFLFNPSAMDEGWIRNTQYAAIATAAVAGGIVTGGILYYGPTIAMPTFAVLTGVIATKATAVTSFGGTAAFSRLVGIGVGRAAALQRAGTISLVEIQAAGITLPIARYWRDFYQLAVLNGTGTDTAPARVALFQKIIDLLNGGF